MQFKKSNYTEKKKIMTNAAIFVSRNQNSGAPLKFNKALNVILTIDYSFIVENSL